MKNILLTSLLFTAFASAQNEPATMALPNGFQPEGIVSGEGTTLYAGSLANGAIYQADVTRPSSPAMRTGASPSA